MELSELRVKMAALEPLDEETRLRIVCALIGHSRVTWTFFGYHYCARCGEEIGDSLAGIFKGHFVVVNHNCSICRENWKKATWQDKLFIRDPFTEVDWFNNEDAYAALPHILTLEETDG